MDSQRRVLRVGAAAIALAVGLKLYTPGSWPEALGKLLVYLETGRVVQAAPVDPIQTQPTTEATLPRIPPVEFDPADGDAVYIRGSANTEVDVQAMLAAPLVWDLTEEAPTVLILHTHATESYTQTAGAFYTESAAYRTLDCDYNMVAVGQRLAELLENAGIGVIHATDLHDYPSYNDGYDNSRVTAQAWLERYPSIRLVLDLHRDAAENSDGSQFATAATVNGQPSAQIMLLLSGGHPQWQENMSLAVKLTAQLEKRYPGITRGIITRRGLYNQDLSPGALLVEVGSAGNTQQEALTAAECLAQAIIAMASGTEG